MVLSMSTSTASVSISARCSSILPASSFEKSNRSLTTRNRCRPDCCRRWMKCTVSAPSPTKNGLLLRVISVPQVGQP